MRPVAVIDSESDPFKKGRIPQPFIWGYYDGGCLDSDLPYRYFTSIRSLVEFLRDKEIVVYAHNGGKFDYHYLLDWVEPFDNIMVINGRLAKFHIGICEFRDSYNILPFPLAAYKKQKFDYSILEESERYKPENWETILKYLESDCVNLFELVTAFIERFGMNMTYTGASMKVWQKISETKAPRSTASYYHSFSPWYFGGRCECFKLGIITEPFKVVDINSAYPFAMLHQHAYGLQYETWKGKSAEGAYNDLEDNEVGPAFFKVRCIAKGAFPYRDTDKSLYFPADNEPREYYVTGWELQAALETETAKEVEFLEARIFDEHISFADYIYEFYNEKKVAKRNGDKANYLFAKWFMNSLYGKFASNPEEYKEYLILDPEMVGFLHSENTKEFDYEDRQYIFAGFFGDKVLAQTHLVEDKQRFYNIATAASITGFVRGYLWRAICNSMGVLYCDTDSIAACESTVEIGEDLGQWETEGEFDRAAIAGRKLYAFRYITKGSEEKADKLRWKIASKGVKLKPSEIWRVARGGTVSYTPEVPTYRVSGFLNKETGKSEIARFISREIKMIPKNVNRITESEDTA